ncbi:fibroblast growth factor 17 [Trichonephila inaurata madagascariensis]|uniref:Fibroblast growth factor 17 n=1 Tax=Trichonephila inaurata madagascariensis TaxID=2747483 RepID=A0A8X6YAB8_9ARAC|nr:fibroblast growth factor 17 [Trichonephila inaurata madagascariensis]
MKMIKAWKRPPINLIVLLSLLTMMSCKDAADVQKDSAKFLMDNSITSFSLYKRRYKFFNQCSEKQIEMVGASVTALGAPDSPNSNLILQTAHYKNVIGFHIIGEKNGRYLCFNKKSKLIVKFSGASPRCMFEEQMSQDFYTVIKSTFHDWYIGFNKKGKAILGSEKVKANRKRCFYFTKRGDHSYLAGLHEIRHGPKIANPYKLVRLLREQKMRRRKRHNLIGNSERTECV